MFVLPSLPPCMISYYIYSSTGRSFKMHKHICMISCHFSEGDNFCDFLFVFLGSKTLSECGLLLKERSCPLGSKGSKFFFIKGCPCSSSPPYPFLPLRRGAEIKVAELLQLKVNLFTLRGHNMFPYIKKKEKKIRNLVKTPFIWSFVLKFTMKQVAFNISKQLILLMLEFVFIASDIKQNSIIN